MTILTKIGWKTTKIIIFLRNLKILKNSVRHSKIPLVRCLARWLKLLKLNGFSPFLKQIKRNIRFWMFPNQIFQVTTLRNPVHPVGQPLPIRNPYFHPSFCFPCQGAEVLLQNWIWMTFHSAHDLSAARVCPSIRFEECVCVCVLRIFFWSSTEHLGDN